LIYGARPERGLDLLLDHILPRLLERDPDFTLVITGYDNAVGSMQAFYAKIEASIRRYGDKITVFSDLSKKELYQVYSTGGVYVYPTPSKVMENFAEVSCITAMECQASGLPIVSSDVGALSETIHADAGVLITEELFTEEYCNAFVDAVMNYVEDDISWQKASNAGIESAKKYDWNIPATSMMNMVEREIRANNSDDHRLFKHFYRMNDLEMCYGIAEQNGFYDELNMLDAEYDFTKSDEKLAIHYSSNGLDTLEMLERQPIDNYGHYFEQTHEPRILGIEGIISAEDDIKSVVDYGCGHGWAPIYIANKTGVEMTGIDIDPGAVDWSTRLAEKFATNKDQVNFYQSESIPDIVGEKDCLIISEVLEHCIDPVQTLIDAEKFVRDDGLVIITVPYGPAEYGTPNWENFRNHIFEFDKHDLIEMLGHKKDFRIGSSFSHKNEHTRDSVGSWLVVYRKDDSGVKERDLDRKAWLQRPKQTVSVSMMVGGPAAEQQILWTLNSVKHIADEIILVDCGMTEMLKTMVAPFNPKIIAGVDPKTEGFETPRNIGIENCSMDWILWIDSDEKLTEPENITKYLRENMYHGYGIKQHHFAIDTSFTPDMPVRFFRNRPHNGESIRFIGMIHEHPELGLNKGPGPIIVLSDCAIAHTGYLTESVRRKRFERNFPMLQRDLEKYPDRLLQKHFIMRDNMLLCTYEMQENGGIVSDNVISRCREVIDIYKEHFLGKNELASIDSLQWYSQALEILGEGIEATYALGISKTGLGDVAAKKYRFESVEALKLTLDANFNSESEGLNATYW